jgi:SOS-response transcriptional repressor LexA
MLGERLKAVRKDLKLSQQEFGEVLEVKGSAISQMEGNLIRPSTDTMLLMYRKFSVNLHWLITGEGTMYSLPYGEGPGSTAHRFEKIKTFLNEELNALLKSKEELVQAESFDLMVSGEIAAGPPVETAGTKIDVVSIRRSMINGVADEFVCLRVNGHSMEPMVLHNDVVIIRKGSNWEKHAGLICALRIDGAITLKRLTFDTKKKLIILLSVNDEYNPILINPRDHTDITLIGSMFYLYRKFK